MQSGNNELSYRLLAGGKTRRKALGHIAQTLSTHPTLAAAAKTLGIHERTLYRWLERYPTLKRAADIGSHDAAVQELRNHGMHVIVPVVSDDEDLG